MAAKAYLSHQERTANEPRDPTLHSVKVRDIEQVVNSIRLIRLVPNETQPTIKFLPGQWLDVHIPGIYKAGGFTLTSTPEDLSPSTDDEYPYLELAIQNAPSNPAAAWLWRPQHEILKSDLDVRVGGSFTWPPSTIKPERIHKVVLVAGGIGINPLISICSALSRSSHINSIKVLYSTRLTTSSSKVLFLERLNALSQKQSTTTVQLFLTGSTPLERTCESMKAAKLQRIRLDDLIDAIGPATGRASTICYVCGPSKMTDDVVKYLAAQEGMDRSRVLCEKWW
ncbi:ferredoxin reductase-like protein [Pseudovirgaria hyperparasitica]|uniref:Oxidoreductase NAD-binding domain-containing protein 1 n=1 Tax=Pseudovirgaria hyperparasitica TaxID=470096 RepID=A0A6A6W3E1_9PEZI|nr:ferredoxin reductase-like protein [Pseudovirgaria hyperparasitica]KAF2756496.1 ferredoxin reductase-like protein [Pseudovirgaria hyperparasitica]